MIAMLGTALLAKATRLEIDPFSLKVGEDKNDNTYSARALCKEVLAAEAPRLGIDLGVTGREPLNNQPFFGKDRVSRDLNVKGNAKGALAILCDILDAVGNIRAEKEARTALRSFLFVRESKRSLVEIEEGEGDNLSEADFLNLVQDFVCDDSEGGKRAQAVAAGLMDIIYGPERVKAARVNDPSRHAPGDVHIFDSKSQALPERVFEVRDKPVSEEDIVNLIERARTAGVHKVAMLAVAGSQGPIESEQLKRKAENRNVRLGLFVGWYSFIREALFWSCLPHVAIGPAFRAIAQRLAELEVSEQGRAVWQSSANG